MPKSSMMNVASTGRMMTVAVAATITHMRNPPNMSRRAGEVKTGSIRRG